MCELISWIEKQGQIFFLTSAEVHSRFGRIQLKGCQGNDFLGHGAIRQYHGIVKGKNYENKNFWDGKLPSEIKQAWNFGSFDGMLKYLQRDDLEYLVQNAPKDFASWCLTKKADVSMKKDADSFTTMFRYAVKGDFQRMISDKNPDIRLFGYAIDHSLGLMPSDGNWRNELLGLAYLQAFDVMKQNIDFDVRIFGYGGSMDFKGMERDGDWRNQIFKYYEAFQNKGEMDIEKMRRDKNPHIRSFVLSSALDFKAMQKDEEPYIRMFGYAAENTLGKMGKDRDWRNRLFGLGYLQDFNAMARDEHPFIKMIGLASTYNFNEAIRPKIK